MAPRAKRSNGEGHTTREGKNYRTVICRDGIKVSANGKTKIESQRRAREKMEAKTAVGTASARMRSHVTLAEFFENWLENEHRSRIEDSTYRRYRGLLQHHIIPGLGKFQLQRITPKDISRLFTSMEAAGQSPRSQQQARAVLSAGYQAAVEQEIVTVNPVSSARKIRSVSKPITPLTVEEVIRILDASVGTYMHARLHVAMILGLRQGEALGLRWADIDFEAKSVRIHSQIQKVDGKRVFKDLKTDKSARTIVIPEATLVALEAHRELIRGLRCKAGSRWQELDLVFPNRHGQPRQSKWDWQQWANLLTETGINGRSLHSARHTAGTLMYGGGVDVETIRRVLGHSSVLLTSRTYIHTAEQPLRYAALKLDSVLSLG